MVGFSVGNDEILWVDRSTVYTCLRSYLLFFEHVLP